MRAITVTFIGGPFDGKLMAVPARDSVPEQKELVVISPLGDLRDDHQVPTVAVGIRRCYYDLALSAKSTGPLFNYLYREGQLY